MVFDCDSHWLECVGHHIAGHSTAVVGAESHLYHPAVEHALNAGSTCTNHHCYLDFCNSSHQVPVDHWNCTQDDDHEVDFHSLVQHTQQTVDDYSSHSAQNSAGLHGHRKSEFASHAAGYIDLALVDHTIGVFADYVGLADCMVVFVDYCIALGLVGCKSVLLDHTDPVAYKAVPDLAGHMVCGQMAVVVVL